VAVYALLLGAALVGGAHEGWQLAATQLLVLAGLLAWLLEMLAAGQLRWRRTALDRPVALLVLLVLAQIALGNRALVAWALAPPADPAAAVELPPPALGAGSVFPAQTVESLLLFLTYAGAYVLVVNVIRRRRPLDRLVRALLLGGGVLAFLALGDYFAGHAWLVWWRGEERIGRLVGPFVNPDHFGAWLVMLVCLGIGYLRARAFRGDAPALADVLHSRRAREEAIRRYLPFAAVALMTLALVFTLSRGALLSLAVGLLALLLVFGRLGQLRWSLAAAGALTVITLGYAAWIGLDPLLARVDARDETRWIQWVSTLPMLADYPLLGVGLGAYKDIYARYQPLALDPAGYFFPYAHSDLLQIAVELGLIGAALVAYAIGRVGRDLVGAHLLGEQRCPVATGSGRHARRRDPFNVGLAVGALAAVLALLAHSAVDFSARIPANGVVAAACLGIATVALHTRFGRSGEQGLAAVRERALGGRGPRTLVAGGAAALAVALAVLVLRPVLVDAGVQGLAGPRGLAVMDRVLAVDRWSVAALRARAQARLAAAAPLLDAEAAKSDPDLLDPAERKRRALGLLQGAVADWRRALALAPSRARVHANLAWGYQALAEADEAQAPAHRRAAIAHLRRASALAPESATYLHGLATLAASPPGPLPAVALGAAGAAAARDRWRLPELIDALLPLEPTDEQWAAVVPAVTLDRLWLATALELRERPREAARMYRQAQAVARPEDEPLARWLLARFLLGTGEARAALAEVEPALRREPDNPELRLAHAEARAALDDPAALDDYRAAVEGAAARERGPGGPVAPFAVTDPRAQALVAGRLGAEGPRVLRYRRALAQHLTDRRLWAQAEEAWGAIVAQAPMDAAAQFSRGLALEGLGQRDRAIEAYRSAVALDGQPAYRFRLARIFWAGDQYVQAVEQWRAIVRAEPDNVEAHLALGNALVRMREPVEAFREFQRVLALEPGHAGARQALARMGTR